VKVTSTAAVWQQGDLTGPFDRHSHLPLVATARAGGAPGPDLPPLGHEPAKSTEVFVVHYFYVFFAEKAVLAPPIASSGSGPPLLLLGIRHFLYLLYVRFRMKSWPPSPRWAERSVYP
jgi:hypothetical protein